MHQPDTVLIEATVEEATLWFNIFSKRSLLRAKSIGDKMLLQGAKDNNIAMVGIALQYNACNYEQALQYTSDPIIINWLQELNRADELSRRE